MISVYAVKTRKNFRELVTCSIKDKNMPLTLYTLLKPLKPSEWNRNPHHQTACNAQACGATTSSAFCFRQVHS